MISTVRANGYRLRRLGRLAVTVALVLLAGCSMAVDSNETLDRRLDLTVQNDGAASIPVRVIVVAPDGIVIANTSERVAGRVAQSFDFTVRTPGRYDVTVTGTDWKTSFGWNAATCTHYAGTVSVTADSLDTAGDCLSQAQMFPFDRLP